MAWLKKSKDIRLVRQSTHWQNIGRIVETDDGTRAELVGYTIRESFAAVNHAIGLLETDASNASSLEEFRKLLAGRKADALSATRRILERGTDGNPR